MPRKKLPTFKDPEKEQEFWASHDSTDYVDWSKARHIRFPNLKPSTKTISLRLPQGLLEDIKIMANRQDVPYQSLIKILLARAVEGENRTSR